MSQTKFQPGDRVRVTDAGSKSNGHVGTVVQNLGPATNPLDALLMALSGVDPEADRLFVDLDEPSPTVEAYTDEDRESNRSAGLPDNAIALASSSVEAAEQVAEAA